MSRFSNSYIRQARPLTNDELMHVVPSAFSAEKHESRSERYTYIPTITLLDRLRTEGFEPYYARQSRVRDNDRREFTKHMIRLRRGHNISGEEIPEIVLLNSHDGSSSYKMIPGIFRKVCSNGLVCWKSFGEISVPHKGDIVGRVIEGAYEVLGVFDKVESNIDKMKGIELSGRERLILGKTALDYKYDEMEAPISVDQVIKPRRYFDNKTDLWTTFNIIQENLMQGGDSRANVKRNKNDHPTGDGYRWRYKTESGPMGNGGGIHPPQRLNEK